MSFIHSWATRTTWINNTSCFLLSKEHCSFLAFLSSSNLPSFFFSKISFHTVLDMSQLNNFPSFADADQSIRGLECDRFVLLIYWTHIHGSLVRTFTFTLASRLHDGSNQSAEREKNRKLARDSDILTLSSMFYWWAPYICGKWVILTHILHSNMLATLLFYCPDLNLKTASKPPHLTLEAEEEEVEKE